MLNHPGSINTVEWTIRERERELAAPGRRFRREWRRRGAPAPVNALHVDTTQTLPARPQSPSPTGT